jgi:hypothetical protein
MPEGRRAVSEITQFKLDYTFWMNAAAVGVVVAMAVLRRKHQRSRSDSDHHDMEHGGGLGLKRSIAYLFAGILVAGMISFFLTHNGNLQP